MTIFDVPSVLIFLYFGGVVKVKVGNRPPGGWLATFEPLLFKSKIAGYSLTIATLFAVDKPPNLGTLMEILGGELGSTGLVKSKLRVVVGQQAT